MKLKHKLTDYRKRLEGFCYFSFLSVNCKIAIFIPDALRARVHFSYRKNLTF